MEKSLDYCPPEAADLLAAVEGDSEAMMRIYLHYERLGRHLIRRSVLNESGRSGIEAGCYQLEDMEQEMFLKFIRAVQNFEV